MERPGARTPATPVGPAGLQESRPAPGPIGVVLAGGRSSRMGRDKATLVLAGQTLAARALERLRPACAEVVVADGGRGVVPGARSVPDGPGRGPAAGLLGAARAAPGRALLVLACDLPLVPVALLAALAATPERPAADVALPRTPRGPEPLVARYSPRALAVLAAQVERGDFALRSLLERDALGVAYLEGEPLARFGDPERFLANVNTPADLARIAAGSL